MKVKLLRATMTAALLRVSALSLMSKSKLVNLIAVEKAELAVEVCEAPIASKEPVVESEPTDSDEVDFSEMTKSQIETYGRKLGIELDRRQTKLL